MPFIPASLTALVQGNSFTLWHYRTADTRADVEAPGYFAPAADNLRPGDLMVLQAADALVLQPFRIGADLGSAVSIDGAVGLVERSLTVSHRFSVTQFAVAVVRSIVLAPLASIIVAGAPIPVSATVTGPVTEVVFTLRDATGAVVPPAQVAPVAGGVATATIPAPPVGFGYRIRVEDGADPLLGATSGSFGIGPELERLLQESGSLLLAEDAGALRL